MNATDERWMREALRLAKKGAGRTSPNPAVGAVVVRGGRALGRGWHRRAGGPHAEIHALRNAGSRARGATLYVTLEPCAHHGRTGPCVEAVLAAKCSRVVIGAIDPNPRVRGRGLARLRRAGVDVDVGVLADECRQLNEDFEKFITTGEPFVVLKLALTIDGRIATRTGDSRWVTGVPARQRVHQLRNRLDAILVGSGTVLADDPRLTCRIPGGRNPLRVVLDGRLRVPLEARIFDREARTRVYARSTKGGKAARLRARGVEVRAGGGERAGALRRVLRDLAKIGVKSVLIEGGARLAARALRDRIVDRLVLFVAPKLVGGDGIPAVASLGSRRMKDALALEISAVERLGPDLLIEARPRLSRAKPAR